MWRLSYQLLFLLFHTQLSLQRSTPESPSYTAAVVEYSPDIYNITRGDKDVLQQNAENYVDIIKTAASQLADIIVFPECGLTTLGSSEIVSSVIPDPNGEATPCDTVYSGVHEAIRILSCAARENSIYVVVNIPENAPCDDPVSVNCIVYYNTNVAFDRNGKVVARYRKFNLFGEPGFNVTKQPDMSVFETDFGVQFGMFTCFDIMFEEPAVDLVKNLGIRDIVFPTAWFSELPFLSAVQEQAAWAQGLGVNFLGAGYNNPAGGSTGSGIYSATHGVINSIMATSRTTKLLVASVPKIVPHIPKLLTKLNATITDIKAGDPTNGSSGIFMKKDNLDPYATYLVIERNIPLKKTLCHNQFCCEFDLKLSSVTNKGYFYRLAVFQGVRSFTFATGGLQICAVVFCADENVSSCGSEIKNSEAFSSTFEYINITGVFQLENAIQLPNTLVQGYYVLPPIEYNFSKKVDSSKKAVEVQIQLKTSQSSLLTFGIYGRNFLKDGQPESKLEHDSRNSAFGIAATLMAISISALAIKACY